MSKTTKKTIAESIKDLTPEAKKQYLNQAITNIENELKKRQNNLKKKLDKHHIAYYKGKEVVKRNNENRLIYYVSRRKEAGTIKEALLKICKTCDDNHPLLKVNIERAGRQLQIKATKATLDDLYFVHQIIVKMFAGKIPFKFNLVSVLYNEMAKWSLKEDQIDA